MVNYVYNIENVLSIFPTWSFSKLKNNDVYVLGQQRKIRECSVISSKAGLKGGGHSVNPSQHSA